MNPVLTSGLPAEAGGAAGAGAGWFGSGAGLMAVVLLVLLGFVAWWASRPARRDRATRERARAIPSAEREKDLP